MHATVIGLIASQHGVVSRAQLCKLGLSPDEVDRAVRNGQLVKVVRGVYADPLVWAANDRWDQRQVLIDRARALVARRPHVRSHDTAGLRLGMQLLKQDGRTHLTLPGRRGTHTRNGLTRHYAPFSDGDLADGGTTLGLARTALDIAREHGTRSGTVAVDSALRLGATYTQLDAVLTAMAHWPGRSHARASIALSDPDTDSIAETLGRELVEELGFGRPQTQFGLAADGRVVWCDLRLCRHFFEIDGKIKLTPLAEGGVADKPVDALWKEKQRQDFIVGFKTGVSHIYWTDFWGAAREEAKARLRREFEGTCRRFGTDISDLAQFRPCQPRRRTTWSPAA